MREVFSPAARDIDADEIFMESDPILVSSDPQSLAILGISVGPDRSKEQWEKEFSWMPRLYHVTSDDGAGIVQAVCARRWTSRSRDHFHVHHEVLGQLRKLENAAYRTIQVEEDARKDIRQARKQNRSLYKARKRFRQAQLRCQTAVQQFDRVERAVAMGLDALKVHTPDGRLNSLIEAQARLESAARMLDCLLPGPAWRKVKNAFRDPCLLRFLEKLDKRVRLIPTAELDVAEREYVLGNLAVLWESQKHRRWKGQAVRIPQEQETFLRELCGNFDTVRNAFWDLLDSLHRSSSGVESINSRLGLYRYTKKRVSDNFANLIALHHNLSPFRTGKRKGKTPAELLGVALPTQDIYELILKN